jgi:hypothetical protein
MRCEPLDLLCHSKQQLDLHFIWSRAFDEAAERLKLHVGPLIVQKMNRFQR